MRTQSFFLDRQMNPEAPDQIAFDRLTYEKLVLNGQPSSIAPVLQAVRIADAREVGMLSPTYALSGMDRENGVEDFVQQVEISD